MNSRVYRAAVWHARLTPTRHEFVYPITLFAFDLDELPALDRAVRGFGHNCFAWVSLRDRDHLRGAGALREKLDRVLRAHDVTDEIARVRLLTQARYLGLGFNPVSFYYCHDRADALRAIVAEVNNTFGERHVYVLRTPAAEPAVAGAPAGYAHYTHDKEFFVSPFNDRRGAYAFACGPLGDTLDIRIDLVRDGATVIRTTLTGRGVELTSRNLAAALLRQPLSAAQSFPRILWQGARLLLQRRLPVHPKPIPTHPDTQPAPTPRAEIWARRAAQGFFDRLRRGRLDLTLPDGEHMVYGGREPGRSAALQVRGPSFFRRLLLDGDVGFADAYVAGEWDSPDLVELLRLFIDHRDVMEGEGLALTFVGRLANRIRHFRNRNTPRGSRRNIAAHYDLGNELYRRFLDESMQYSSALYERPDDTLEAAQKNKLRRIIELARIGPDDHVLEIGCGWGAFALAAARATGCRVTGITLSTEQLAWARERAAAAGLADRVTFELRDYRARTGQFSRIVSIEMLEAVGHRYFGDYFAACDRLLAPDGLVVVQVITIPDQRYDAYLRSPDWIQRRVFPGGELPSLTALTRAMTRHSRLFVQRLENIGPHYAPTLREWRRRFEERRAELEPLGYDEHFQRSWRYYLAYCEAGFAARVINNLHLVLTRDRNPNA